MANHNPNNQWQKGQPSPNPNGRPKKEFSITNTIKEYLDETAEIRKGRGKAAQTEQKKRADILVETLFKMAAKGDINALKYLIDRVEGKPLQAVEQSGELGVTVTFHNSMSDV